jgi:hypothetical protein
MPEQSIAERLAAVLERQDDEAERALHLLYGELPAWFPMPRLEYAKRTVYGLGNDGFTPEQIAKFVSDEIANNERLEAGEMISRTVPGGAIDSGAFIRAVNELAHIKYALSLPGMEGLEMLAGVLAASGAKSAYSHKERAKDKDIVAFQEAAKALFKANGYNIAKTLREPFLAEYVRRHYGARTLHNALVRIRPKGKEQKGRPRKGNVTP